LFCHKNPQECGARVRSPVRSFGGGKGLDDVVVGRKEKEREVLRPTDSSQRTANGKLTGEVLHR
jgi:hypothetical protein